MRGLRESIVCSGSGRAIAALLIVVVVTACAPQAAQESPELGALTKRWEDAFNSGDLDGLAAMYTEDCRLLPPNADMAQGRDAVRANFTEMIDAGLTGELETVEAVVAGNLGHKLGVYSVLASDGTVIDRGKFLETWEKTAAGWQMNNDIWNSDWAPGANTTTTLISLEVKDFGHWIAAFRGEDSRPELFARNGAASTRMFQSADDPNRVALLLELNNAGAFTAFVGGEESTKAKAEDGVINSSLHMLTEVN